MYITYIDTFTHICNIYIYIYIYIIHHIYKHLITLRIQTIIINIDSNTTDNIIRKIINV